MSLAGARLNLIDRCTIERDASTGTDDGWGNPETPDWQPHLNDVPCRLWADTGREIVAGETTITPVEDVRLIVPVDTDVTDSDRIATVTNRGDAIHAGPLGIRAVLPRRDHLELVLVRVA